MTMKQCLVLTAVIYGLAPIQTTALTTQGAHHQGYLERARSVVQARVDLVDPNDLEKGSHSHIAACLAADQHLEWASARLIRFLENPRGDMFWMFPMTSIAYLGKDKLSEEAHAALRHAWKTYVPLRGDTENHWAMYYGSLFLMAEYWPDLPGSEWYNGKSSEENLEEAREYLIWWMDITTSMGQGEYDCTHYIGEYLIPMLHLAAWAEDPEMRLRGEMMVDWILSDFAIDSLNGLYVGAHARTDDRQVLETWYGLSTFFAWLYFGNTPEPPPSWGIFTAVAAEYYHLPEVLYKIATDRSQPYLSRELKRTRERWRFTEERFKRVYKTTYVTEDYAVGSDQGGLLQPIQQHSWDVTWAVDDPRGVHNTMFSINPYWSTKEMQMYFSEYPDFMPPAVTNQGKPTYMAEDTFLGGSDYEQVFQDLDTIVALYHMSEEANHKHIHGFFSKDLTRLEEDDSGWIFAQGGNTYLAYFPMAAYEWRPLENGGKRLYSPHAKNGTIIQAASAAEFKSWDAFRQAMRALPLEISMDAQPRVWMKTLRGNEVFFEYDGIPMVNGKQVDYAAWPLFESPFMEAAPGSRKLTLRHGDMERVLDFDHVERIDRVIPRDENEFNVNDIRP